MMMTKEQERMRLYHLNNSNRKVRLKMMRTLTLTSRGEYDRARSLLNETRREFDQIRREEAELALEMQEARTEAVEAALEFTDVLHEAVSQANRLHSRQCSGVKFHIYN